MTQLGDLHEALEVARLQWAAAGSRRKRQPSPVRSAFVVERRGTWRTFGERTVYDNRWVRLGLADVEAPNGERWEYHVVHLARIAIALIVNEPAGEVLMLWRYRFATDQWGYELLGGLVDEGEEPAGTAAREAAEESGWAPVGEPEKLISFQPLPGNVTAPMDVYLWRDSEHVGEPTDAEEAGRVEWVPLSRVTELAARGELLGAGSVCSAAARCPSPHGDRQPCRRCPHSSSGALLAMFDE